MAEGTREAEVVVNYALSGMNFVLRLVGQSVPHIAAMLQALKNQPDNSPGVKTMKELMKSGESMAVFTVPENRLEEFAHEAKRYGIQYVLLKREDYDIAEGTYDLCVKQSDAAKINRVVERLGLGTVANIETSVSEADKQKAVSLSEAQKLMQDMFAPNREEREADSPNPSREPTVQSPSGGSSKYTGDRTSIRMQMQEAGLEAESVTDVFAGARALRKSMMTDAPAKGWRKPEEQYDAAGTRLYRGKSPEQMTEKDTMQFYVDNEMESHGMLSDEFIAGLFEKGYRVDEDGMVQELKTQLTSRERVLIAEMMRAPEAGKEMLMNG